MPSERRATVEDLYNAPKDSIVELVNRELRSIGPREILPGRASGKIRASLIQYEEENGGGFAIGGKIGILVALPNRESFSPCAA